MLALTNWIVARPLPRELDESSVSIVCACRNEQGHIAELIDRVPDFGVPTELIFVEGNSTDDTRGEIQRQIEAHPERDIRFVPQTGKGKGDAVRTGFAAAKHDVLMVLDGDMSVSPRTCRSSTRPRRRTRGVRQRLAARLRHGAGLDALPEHDRKPCLRAVASRGSSASR